MALKNSVIAAARERELPSSSERSSDEDWSLWARGCDEDAAEATIEEARRVVAAGGDPVIEVAEPRLDLAAHRPLAARALAAIVHDAGARSERARRVVAAIRAMWPGDPTVTYLLRIARHP